MNAVVVDVLEYSERALLDYAGGLVVVLLFCLCRADVAQQRSKDVEELYLVLGRFSVYVCGL